YGENLYAGGGNGVTFGQGMKAWMDEASKYNYANPVFSGATGNENRPFIIIVSISGKVNSKL
ncbi:hypothetical protein BGZ68_001733, partial [Mortierella alpina]